MAERRLPTPLTVAFQERASAELCTLKRSLHDKLKKDITREVYNQNVLKHKEDAVVAHIRYLRGEKEGEVGSPESDVFVTPKASPSDPHFGGSFEAATHRAYYSLVHLEDHNSQSLERELAEQDELSKSFRSILIKENQPTPVKQRSVKSSKSYEQVRIEPPLKPSQPRQTYQKSKLVLKLTDEMSLKKEEEVMSNPDSCLEPMSSGYATGCSPKDTNNSEALGADTTEIVTSEDIPHDDKSRGSSSVSSDPGTWDSTFPTNDEDTCIEKEHPEVAQSESAEKETLSPGKNPSEESQHHSKEKHEYMCRITEKKDSYLSIMTENKLKPPSHEYSSCSSPNNFFIDASSLRDENEMYLPSIRNPVFPSTCSEPKTINCDDLSLKNETEKSDLEISKFNCFYEKEDRSLNNLETKEVKDEFLENHKLIRRNTFDLDPEDTMLSRLKDDYGNSLPPSGTSTTVDDLNKINKEGKPKGAYSECSKYITGKEDDVHSPDSLNNDFHSESFTSQNTHQVHYASTHMLNGETFTCAEVHSEPVSSTAEVEHTITSTNDEANKDSLSYNKLPSDLGTGFDLNNSYESESPRRSGNSTSSPKSNASYTKESYYDKLEGTPIVSGGTQISDVSSSEYSVTASPVTRRKTEHAPILSGGFDDIPMPEEKKPKPKSVSSLSTSWVVDMSDVGKSPPESLNENKPERQRSSNSGTGFFIPLDDPFPSFDSYTSTSSAERSDSGHNRRNSSFHERNSSCGFFIDLNENANEKRTPIKTEVPSQEKKLFSMFIDIGNSKSSDSTSPKSKPGSPFFPTKRKGPSIAERLSAKHLDKKSNSTSSDSGLDLVEHPEIAKGRMLFNENLENSQNLSDSSNYDSGIATKRQSFYMFIGNEESPVTRRRTLPPNIRQNPNRHSWNNELKQAYKSETLIQRKEHKRSSSVSYDQSFPEDRLTSGPTSIEESCLKHKEKKNKSMLSSWHGPIKPSSELTRIIANGAKQEFKEKARESNKSMENSEAEKAEDMSCSVKSDEVFDVSNATVSSKDDTNRTFIVDDVSKAVNVNTNDLELSTPSQDIVSDFSKDDSATDPVQEPKSTCSDKTNKSSVCEGDLNTPKQLDPVEPPLAVQEASSGFLKLSDMDKAPVVQTWKSVSRSSSEKNSRMTRSIPEASFLEQRVLTNSASSRSLSRLFPHLYPKTDSREGSQQSSMQSSIIEPSPLEVSTEEEGSCGSGGGGSCSRLGEDLLRMFLDEISPDVTVEVGGRRIKAHKCILSSRCQYFAGMLSGGWVESAGNVISLQGFNYNTVHFALCHIYSGASQIPETINIVELATLADMLCLEGLKEVIMYTLKVKYCHFFHKPCSGCLVGVVECLPLAAAYSLDEIYRKSLRWITKHFVKVWPTKGFASLPKELLDKCLKQQIVHLCCDNILETVMGCDKLEATIPNVRWANPVFSLNSKLHEASVKYLTQHFSSVLASQTFMHLGQEDSWTVTRLEETLLNVSKSLSPDQSCQSYKRIKAILADINRTDLEEIDFKLEFLELLTKLETTIEDCLIRQAGRAARTTSWAKMDLSLRRKIQEAACLVFTPGPRPSSSSRDVSRTSKHGEMKPKSPAPSQASSRRSVAPSPAAPKTTQSPLPKPRTPKNFSQVKSRYLEPKPARREGEPGQSGQQGQTQRRLSGGSGGGKAISSSDSSRNSSPAATRVSRPGTAERRTPVAGRRLQGPGSQPSPPPPRATFSPNPKDSQKPTTSKVQPEVKDQLLKRQSTFRVATKSSVAKQVAPGSRQPSKTRPQSSNIPTKAGVTVTTGRAKTASTVRSGTFLREDSAHGQRRPH